MRITLLLYILLVLTINGCESGEKPKKQEESTSSSKQPSPDFPSLDSLKKCSAEELRIVRNTLFAKYGYIFKSDDLKQHFSKLKWYKPEFEDQDTVLKMFSALDKTRLGIVKELESSLKIPDYRKTVKTIKKPIDSNFIAYVDSLPFVKLPYTQNCLASYSRVQAKHYPEYKPDGASIIGKLHSNDSCAIILYTYPADVTYPIAEFYRFSGEKISQQELFPLHECAFDPIVESFVKFTVFKDLTIERTVTSITCERQNEDVCDTTKISFKDKLVPCN